jgi:hypothetical protein
VFLELEREGERVDEHRGRDVSCVLEQAGVGCLSFLVRVYDEADKLVCVLPVKLVKSDRIIKI